MRSVAASGTADDDVLMKLEKTASRKCSDEREGGSAPDVTGLVY